ncbi:MAG: S1C family serine protease [Gemmatimonas sp.]|jgi:S1-C subfamily serine protease
MILPVGRSTGVCAILVWALLGAPVHGEQSVARHAAAALPSLAPVVARVLPAVVAVTSTRRAPEAEVTVNPATGFPDPPLLQAISVAGSGVIVNADLGLIVTGNHVVEGAADVTVTLSDGRRLDAIVAAADKVDDLAVLRIAASGLVSVPLGDADSLQIGDFVLAIGHPLGGGRSATFGIVSALHGSCPGIGSTDLIVTDALLERGNSGGPLINVRGELVGINVARNGRPDAPGFGFAVPVDAVRALVLRAQTS